jgi:hypothetical protein
METLSGHYFYFYVIVSLTIHLNITYIIIMYLIYQSISNICFWWP